ncbi:hypothetical protein CA13_01020 [Planctomycetes bacterium CA13]|uniref:Uncharacterized protein n=1 Tax=Novipirellula herctigrandis TaxID=2527986 RepID=A0A5C5YUR0_9BACT|nr:hypothetical protein CA13_01020 [Planctomycetes bacterium CA13]
MRRASDFGVREIGRDPIRYYTTIRGVDALTWPAKSVSDSVVSSFLAVLTSRLDSLATAV